ncbi:soma ferritin isoform X2 [Lucilia sericata]|uniref:soma ferritin isoform X2 n=1 Tax=Lucilia sericata TaxID=13632 RepID=UPI0018A7F553|nr:soma ferritin isoform X2 [Lucilia sericata]XP_037814987.1 soma ferritin isoform X2 [Lucilia sericata]
MKSFIVVALLAAICAVVKTEEVCHSNVVSACASSTLSGTSICNSRYGGIEHIEPEVQAYINSHLTKSYEYLLLATHFNSYQKNRPGFQKLYQSLSDRSFDDTIDMIKQVTRRGGKANFNVVHESPATVSKSALHLEVDELHSLAMALDTEKQLSNGAIHVHTRSLHANSGERDPEMAQYMEEKFLTKQAATVRKLSGYANDLSKLMNQQDPSLAVYLFDEYLQKQ